MPALSLDLSVEQGTTWSHGFIPRINGVAVLTTPGWSARAQIRTSVADSTVLYEWSTATGNLTVDTGLGSITMTLTPTVSSGWAWRSAVYDMEITSPDGTQTYRVVQGNVSVSPEVTR